jgi:mandelate racemase
LLQATPTAHFLEHLDIAAPLLRQPLAVQGGMALVPDAPGLGLDWDQAALRHFQVDA